ncbi:hypothetical protein DM860_001412 [Cuscuta australis]|uniref:Protein kinase domain-containing protein n=1 Tax=Cuscuta australis TaxID=267555 RepID=A0A328E8F5_9ASTE|nr:hypothetical protein DM860_001412 [Cuscuta australis]
MKIRYDQITSTTIIPLCCCCLLLQTVYSQGQKNIMVSLYDMIQNNTGAAFAWSGTNIGSHPCSWKGVTCAPNASSTITAISLRKFSISTPDVFPLLCGIKSLESLDLSDNQLSSIPDGFIAGCGGIRGLRVLNLSSNFLTGPLPRFRQGFGALESLDLSKNNLSGIAGLQLDSLSSLKSLNLSSNGFVGPIPVSLGKANALSELRLSDNGFEGEIPSQIVRYGNLTYVDLSFNQLSGSIPESLGDLSRLDTLILSGNSLNGSIPHTLGKIKTFSRFAANQNVFVGSVPVGLTTYLINVDLSFNRLNGTIPLTLLSPPNLQYVDLSNNNLEGSIPTTMSSSLDRLRLGNNYLFGPIPGKPFRSLQNLTYLELENNHLNGSIPVELFLCQNLALLNLAQNELTGSLPVQVVNLPNLEVLKLQMNHLVGEIPRDISNLSKLQRLNMSWNSLTGSIPDSISSLKNLANLDLKENKLNGSIPKSISTLNRLLELELGNNRLSGTIPQMPIQLQIALNLSHNLFSGTIPTTLSALSALEVLDLSYNILSGQIPDYLTKMSGLTQIILANNQLSGLVPTFPSYVSSNFRGNKGLILPPPKPGPNSQPMPSKRKLSVAVVIGVALAGFGAALFLFITLSIWKAYYHSGENASSSSQPPQVVRGKLLTANGLHKSCIDFKKAMEAVTETSNIVLKTRLSTYHKAAMPSGASYLVKRLNYSHKIIQFEQNSGRFGREVERLGKLSNSNIMTPLAYTLTADSVYLFYEFPPAGTLYEALHHHGSSKLDWGSRYSIAIGVAQGLAFLHSSSSSSPILLLDLSSKTIMLKSLKEPRIGEIEVYNLIADDPSKGTGNLSTVAGSVGYIPPEYAYTMKVTMAGNVYSFGVVLLELVTGKPAVSQGTELAKLIVSSKSGEENKWGDIILDFDESKTSVAAVRRRQMVSVMKVALACVSVSPEGRPKMKTVLRMLLNAN